MTSDIQNGLYFKVISQKSTTFYYNCKKTPRKHECAICTFRAPMNNTPTVSF